MKLSLRAARINAGLTRAQVAEAIGRSKATIHNWETERTMPDGADLIRFAEAVGVKVENLRLEQENGVEK